MTPLLIAINIIAGLFLIGVVLLQSGKGADMGAAFGGANSTMFGPSGAGNALTKATAACAALFMLTSLTLAVRSSEKSSVFDDVQTPSASAPAATGDAIPDPTADATPPSGAFDPEAAAEAALAAAALQADEAVAEDEKAAGEAATAAEDLAKAQQAADNVAAEANKAADSAKTAAVAEGEAAAKEADDTVEKAGAASEVEKAASAVDEKLSEQ